jgi:hypothetical protein
MDFQPDSIPTPNSSFQDRILRLFIEKEASSLSFSAIKDHFAKHCPKYLDQFEAQLSFLYRLFCYNGDSDFVIAYIKVIYAH